MDTSPEEQLIILLGFPGGEEAEQACQQAEQQGLHCRVLNWSECHRHNVDELSKQRFLPIILGDWLHSATLQEIMRWAGNMGLYVLPVGDMEMWERVVPLENSEWVGMKVYRPDGEWPEKFRRPKPATIKQQSTLLSGTLICSDPVELTNPLVDLNTPVVPSGKPAHTTGTPVTKNKQRKKQAGGKSAKVLILLLLMTALFAGSVYSFYLYARKEVQRKRADLTQTTQQITTQEEVEVPARQQAPPCTKCSEITEFPLLSNYESAVKRWEKGAENGCSNCSRLLEEYNKKQAEESTADVQPKPAVPGSNNGTIVPPAPVTIDTPTDTTESGTTDTPTDTTEPGTTDTQTGTTEPGTTDTRTGTTEPGATVPPVDEAAKQRAEEEAARKAREKAAREAREKAVREAREKAAREAKEKAEREKAAQKAAEKDAKKSPTPPAKAEPAAQDCEICRTCSDPRHKDYFSKHKQRLIEKMKKSNCPGCKKVLNRLK